jgi:hypothetical protein
MAGADNLVFNTLEKFTSGDLNNAQALEARVIATLLRYSFQSRFRGFNNDDTLFANPAIVGLGVIPNGTSVRIQPGALLQDSASLSPTPGTYDSNYRIALNVSTLDVVAPAPVSNTFYLLEAQMQEETTSESRQVLNPATGDFSSTSVPKIRQRTLATRWVAGSSFAFPNPGGGDWVVLAGVYRSAGGGVVGTSDIWDMRLEPSALIAEASIERAVRVRQHHLRVPTDNSETIEISAEADCYDATYGRALHLSVNQPLGAAPVTGLSLNSSEFMPAAAPSPVANTWHYLWLVPWKGLAPVKHKTELSTRGILVLTTNAYAPDDLSASRGTLDLPSLYGATPAPAGAARCIGILRRNAANTGWRQMTAAGGEHRLFNGLNHGIASSTVISNDHIDVAVSTSVIPRGVRFVTLGIAATGLTFASPIDIGGLAITVPEVPAEFRTFPAVSADFTDLYTEVTVPFNTAGYTVRLSRWLTTINLTAGVLDVYVKGWKI